jgi:hypothetical protein
MSLRPWLLVLALAAGCSFAVTGRGEDPKGGPTGPAPAPSADGGTAPGPTPSPTPTPGPAPSPPVVGSPCTSDADCGGLKCLQVNGNDSFPGGYCTVACTKSGPAGCMPGSTCVDVGDGNQYCLASCSANDCRDGYVCCKATAACMPSQACN